MACGSNDISRDDLVSQPQDTSSHNPMNYDWFTSVEKPNGNIEVYAGWGNASLQDFIDHGKGDHGHFRVEPGKEEVSGRPGPRGTEWHDPPPLSSS